MIRDDEKLELFVKWRIESIELLTKSKISKNEFLNRNYDYLKKLDLKPFSNIDTVEKALYNYQYYNIMAKRNNYLAQKYKDKKKKLYKKFLNERENCYYLKDNATKSFLDLINYNDIEGYYINVNSKRLSGKIYEIYVINMQDVILHSKNLEILNNLKVNGKFDEISRDSLIDSYVNKSY